ncbi:flagellar motor switch protein FliG [Terriglobus tenax]|uniref:flagellar motor switch protein FliG n=1 Tax=Terriglobus tenax TaxID=1111115 RepID=UPI0021DF6762|nr:flagellar motor switch protein FliG [Terriglobus tenax]
MATQNNSPLTRAAGLRKAAIFMVAVGDDLAKEMFQYLSETDVQRVTEEIMRLGNIAKEELSQVVGEYYALQETQKYVTRGGVDYARRLLQKAFGENRAEELLNEVWRLRERSMSDLTMLQKIDPSQLAKFLDGEHPQTVALVLAHLEGGRAALVLMALNDTLRIEVVKRLAEMRQFSPEMAQKVALMLYRRSESIGQNKRHSYAGFKAVAEMLNRVDQTVSKKILEGIEENQPEIALGIRNLMFTFDDLLTVPQTGIREIVGAADKRVLATAMRGCKDTLRAHLFQAMSSRAAEMLREDMEVMGPVRSRDVAQAQQELLALARRLESEGKIMLRLETENDLSV